MGHVSIEVVVFAMALLAMVTTRDFAGRVREAIENFRGGPPTSMPPLPSNDGALLGRRLQRRSDF